MDFIQAQVAALRLGEAAQSGKGVTLFGFLIAECRPIVKVCLGELAVLFCDDEAAALAD